MFRKMQMPEEGTHAKEKHWVFLSRRTGSPWVVLRREAWTPHSWACVMEDSWKGVEREKQRQRPPLFLMCIQDLIG